MRELTFRRPTLSCVNSRVEDIASAADVFRSVENDGDMRVAQVWSSILRQLAVRSRLRVVRGGTGRFCWTEARPLPPGWALVGLGRACFKTVKLELARQAEISRAEWVRGTLRHISDPPRSSLRAQKLVSFAPLLFTEEC